MKLFPRPAGHRRRSFVAETLFGHIKDPLTVIHPSSGALKSDESLKTNGSAVLGLQLKSSIMSNQTGTNENKQDGLKGIF